MRSKTAQALSDWRAAAAALKKEREGEPGAFTTQEFADEAGMQINAAYQHLLRGERKGKFRKSKKVVEGRLVAAWVMVSK